MYVILVQDIASVGEVANSGRAQLDVHSELLEKKRTDGDAFQTQHVSDVQVSTLQRSQASVPWWVVGMQVEYTKFR